MRKVLIVAAVLMAVSAQVQAQYLTQNWKASGILTTQNRDLGYFKTEYVELKNFESKERCEEVVKSFSGSSDKIGKGGTDNKVDGVEWNYDATCYETTPFF